MLPPQTSLGIHRGGASHPPKHIPSGGAFACNGIHYNTHLAPNCLQSFPIHYPIWSSRRQHRVTCILENAPSFPMSHSNQSSKIRGRGREKGKKHP